MYFDGSDVGLYGSLTLAVDAFHIMTNGDILVSLSGILSPNAKDADIYRFVPTSLGPNTAGSFLWYIDGSDVGLTGEGENIDAIQVLDDGDLILSVSGTADVPGLSGIHGEDLIRFSPTNLGSSTSGTWSMYFDGSDVDLADSAGEDIWGVWIDANGDVYMSSEGSFSVPGLSGVGSDIFDCMPLSLGSDTSCAYSPSLYWDGSANGHAAYGITGLYISRQ